MGSLDLKRCIFVLICIFPFCLSLGPKKTACMSQGPCRCLFPNNLGIDIKKLGDLTFSVDISTDQKLLYSPCKDHDFANKTSCESVSICLEHKENNSTEYHNLGNAVHSKIMWESISLTPMIHYNLNETITSIECSCIEGAAQFNLISASDKFYELKLSAEECCVRNLSYGPPPSHGSIIGVIAIIVLVIFLMYLIGGFLVLKFIRGAEGVEAIPNHEFWLSVPDRIKSGFLWLLRGCKSPPSYDRI